MSFIVPVLKVAMSSTSSLNKRWQCRLTNTRERIAHLKDSGHLTDLSVAFSGHERVVQTHRFLLAASSPVFEAMLCGPMAAEGTLTLSDDLPEAFDWLLEYIYCEKVILPDVEMAIHVYIMAHKYQMDAVCDICSKYLINEVDEGTFPFVYETAIVLEDQNLLQRCDEVLATSSEAVLASRNIGHLRSSTLKRLVSHPMLNVSSEGQVVSALVTWGLAQLTRSEETSSVEPPEAEPGSDGKAVSEEGVAAEVSDNPQGRKKCLGEESLLPKLRQVVREFLPLVRFLSMTSKDFIKDVLPSGVISEAEGVAILQWLEGAFSIPLPNFVGYLATKPRKVLSTSVLFNDHKLAKDPDLLLYITTK
nr:kelch-like protein 8 [Cherax quadricarinatus]